MLDEISARRGARWLDRADRKDHMLTEDLFARQFEAVFSGRLLFDHVGGYWYKWDGNRWKREVTQLAFDYAREIVVQRNEFVLAKWNRASVFKAVEVISRADRAFAATINEFDRDPWLLGTPGGTVDLRTGQLRASDPNDRITKTTSCAPCDRGNSPLKWFKFLREATQGDDGLIRFLQQVCGYSLTGVTTEHAMVFIYGPGGNGKSVFVGIVSAAMGDYAIVTPMEILVMSRNDRHPTELADLKGARLVSSAETEEGRFWAETKLKQLTGGDRIKARFMRQDFFEFQPEFKLVVVGNHKPRIKTTDDAMRRRINIVDFPFKPEVANTELSRELLEEAPQILRWMINGCLDWQKNGLVRPRCVIDATNEYFAEHDLLSLWLDDCCELGRKFSEPVALLFHSWSDFCRSGNEEVGSKIVFSKELGRRGFKDGRGLSGERVRNGLKLITKEVGNGYYS